MEANFFIKEYSSEYREKAINLMIDVAVKELGFEEWEEHFLKADFLEIGERENFWIAVNEEDEVIGTIGVLDSKSPSRNLAKLKSLYVNNDYRKQGIATELLNKSINFAKKCNYKKIILSTQETLKEAIKFYTKNGFELYYDIDDKESICFCKDIC